jgi:hypothetical protein
VKRVTELPDTRRIIARVIVEHNVRVITSARFVDEIKLGELMSIEDAHARLDAGETVADLVADPPFTRNPYLVG